MPNDEDELDRLSIIHQVHLHLFNNNLTTVPLDNPTKILDVGTGTGEWAIEMGERYPATEVIGTDIAKVQPSAVPENVYFEIDDAEEEGGWARATNDYDLIHFRNLAGAFMDWRKIYQETFTHLKPGGWIEVLDYDDHRAFLGFFSENSEMPRFMSDLKEASVKSGRPRGAGHLKSQLLIDAGFVDVQLTDHDIPLGAWPDDPEEQSIGKLWLIACLCGVEAACLRLLTREMGWDPDEVKMMCDIISTDLRAVATDPERAKGLSFKIMVLIGRKPGPDENIEG